MRHNSSIHIILPNLLMYRAEFWKSCTYSFERLLNDDNIFSFKTKLIIMFIFRALQIYNLLLNIRYFLFL